MTPSKSWSFLGNFSNIPLKITRIPRNFCRCAKYKFFWAGTAQKQFWAQPWKKARFAGSLWGSCDGRGPERGQGSQRGRSDSLCTPQENARQRETRQTNHPTRKTRTKDPPQKRSVYKASRVRLVELTARVDTKVYSPGQTGPGRSL